MSAKKVCGHVNVVRKLDQWPEVNIWIANCRCRDCGHEWKEISPREPAHTRVRRSLGGAR
jgi:predicted Zn-ribbon and HTH transcriptional regulator